ncbi:general transcription factor IIE subunit 1-like [Impatiens glandulifera]|uniref:general transcription factor IIE subunit 1-like n=1 Tax=Impatiens glandulifera TaxID=253017 RepID=UPI001FB1788D|nr:general transcription factor IIE subunit 1-like [Impatiens glandulifera]XP_047330798.1 general transcription factor IIE subunit 1-like [Impatiens glandulifera]
MSVEPFNRLVKLAARAFYDDITTKGENQQPKTMRSDNRGIAVVILDALTRRQWVREEDLAKDLKLHSKQLRRTLRFFEEEKLVTRDHRKESAKGAKIHNAAVAAVADGQFNRDGDDKIKLHTHSYCCLDYAQIFDVVRYRLQRMRKKLKDELDNRNTIQEYICPNCGKRYNALDALQLMSPEDEDFHCESCNGALVAESDKLAAQETGDGDENARRRRRDKLKDMLQKMEEQLKPLSEQLNRVKDLPVPEFGPLAAWEIRYSAARRANGDSGANDSKNSLGYGGTPMPFVGETKVEVAFSGEEKGDIKPENSSAPTKVLPPWMIKQGMNLTKEQRGEVKEEVKGGSSTSTKTSVEFSDDKKSNIFEDNNKNIQDEYVKAYYAAMHKRQLEQEEASKKQQELSNAGVSERQVGMKSKRAEDEVEDDGVEWEEVAPVAAGQTVENYKVNDLNVEAASGDEEEDDDDIWEEG